LIEDIAHFLRISATKDQIKAALGAANIERMREIERAREGEKKDPNASFYRGGETGQWSQYFTKSIEERFYQVSEKAMKLGGYL
jgi:hypothetical protein